MIGEALEREDAVAKVTGQARYTADLEPPGCLHAAIARSAVAHGRILEVDTSEARAVPGVRNVLVGDDLRALDPVFGEWILNQVPLAIDRVRYHGEPIAAVVADSPVTARHAAALVRADIDPLPQYLSIDAALAGAEPIHPVSDLPPNVCYAFDLEVGDVDAGMAEAAWVHDATYTFPAAYHYAMEPFACIATWDGQHLDVVSATQQPFKVRGDLARIFRLQLSDVSLRVPFVGGGYGSKGQSKYEPLTAALALRAGRPVKLVVGVDEAFMTVTRHAARVRVRTGVAADGSLVARETWTDYDTGGYADKGPRVAKKGAYRAAGPYRISNVRAHARAVYTNHVPAGAFRGFATPQVVWAAESAMDEIAQHLGIDPLEFRLSNLKDRGQPFLAPEDTPLDADLREGLRVAADGIDWGSPLPVGTGRGIAVAAKDGGGGSARSEATVRLHPDGSVEVYSATVELGQGSRTIFRQIASDALGCGSEAVSVAATSTSTAPFDRGTNASRSTISVGSAVADACARLRSRVEKMLVDRLGSMPGEWRIDGSHVVTTIAGERSSVELAELLASALGLPPAELGPLVETGVHETGSGSGPLGSSTPFYEVAHGAAHVDLDRETGEIRLLSYTSVADVGRAINPVTCVGQDEGAAVMGLGHTLHEEIEYDSEGRLSNGAMHDYRVPRAHDIPEHFHTRLLENGDGPGPGGSKGAGEGGIIPIAPAIANALAAATGVRFRDLPLTPERVWRSLRSADGH